METKTRLKIILGAQFGGVLEFSAMSGESAGSESD